MVGTTWLRLERIAGLGFCYGDMSWHLVSEQEKWRDCMSLCE